MESRCHDTEDVLVLRKWKYFFSLLVQREIKIKGCIRKALRADVSLVEKEVLDTVREEKAGSSVEATSSETSANTETTQLRQRAGTWTEERVQLLKPHEKRKKNIKNK